MATQEDKESIFNLRHTVYATELGQHRENLEGRLSDNLDSFNRYIVAKIDGAIAGFISITPPDNNAYSIDKYFSRDEVPASFDGRLYELRLLTVVREFRGSLVAPALMYAALRWIEASGGANIVAIGRVELLDLYKKATLCPTGKRTSSGAVTFELLTTTVTSARRHIRRSNSLRSKMEYWIDWQIETPNEEPKACYHGGAFFDAIGREFDNLQRIDDVINADVLDAWFPPSPKVTQALSEYLPWSISTSPPTGSEGLITSIGRARGIEPGSVLPGSGSSSLIFLALRSWLISSSRALILDPSYGEYAHVLENVVRCRVDRFPLRRSEGYQVDLRRLEAELDKGYDIAVLVNPNNPTGQHVPRQALEDLLVRASSDTVFWIDETYIDYVDHGESLERFASDSPNVVVCKSMSKVYALSGLRVGYLCGPGHLIEELRPLTAPWSVSLPGQMAAIVALQDPGYYAKCYLETHVLRTQLANELRPLDLEVVPSVANVLLCQLPYHGPSSTMVADECRRYNLFIRDLATTPGLGARLFRIAVKDAETNERMVEVLGSILKEDFQGLLSGRPG